MSGMGLPTSVKGPLLIAGILAIAYFGACLFLYLRQNRFIFFPAPVIETTPAELELKYEEVWIPVSQKSGKVERIHGWWIPSETSSSRVLLYLHGNGVNIGANVNHAARFHQLGFSVLLIDYRGYGLSEGSFPTENTVFVDAETAWNYLVQDRGIAPEQIFLYGHSLGGAIAIDLASRQPDAAGAIVQSSFTTMREMVDYRFHFWMFPIDLILTHRFDSRAKISQLQIPVLFIHGTADPQIPSEMTEELYRLASEPKQLFLVADAGHNNVASIAGEAYFQAVRDFISITEEQPIVEMSRDKIQSLR
ncbi:alpha/beta hydrolase [Laspinema palackyanum]|uniref:alpha/beta hydrolase n=1 Tax=Laspinema palackyanum TaxID=3231601 RepID=UPI00345CE548|nr:lysophospholipase [Laspinema sp. D2c]